MLKQLRNKKTAKRILWTLAIIIIPPFVFWGAGGLLKEKREINYAGKIFGRKIGFSEYRNSYLAVRNQWVLRYGEENFEKLEKYLGLSQQAWERLILLYETDKRRLKIKDSEVISTIEKMPIFQKNNLFDQKVYDYVLRYILRTPARLFEENIRDGLKISKLYEEVTAEINASDQELETEYKKENEQVKVEYALVSSDKEKAYKILAQIKASRAKNPKESFAGLTKSLGLEIKETPLFKRNDPIEGIGKAEEFANIAFGTLENNISEVIEADKNFYIILGVKQFVGIDKEKFAEERQDFKDKLLTRKKEEAFMKFMQELQTKAKITSYISRDYNPNLYR